MKRTRIAVLLAAALLLGTVAVVASADAVTGWSTYGSSNARGNGLYGHPSLTVDSTTLRRPTRVRMEVTASPYPAPRTYVSWRLTCWNESNYDYESRSGSGTVSLPWAREMAPTVPNPTYCKTYVSTYHSKTGRLFITQMARY